MHFRSEPQIQIEPIGAGAATPLNLLDEQNFCGRIERQLRENILPFWIRHARTNEPQFFHGEVDSELRPTTDAPRSSILSSRIMWAFSAAYRRYQDPSYLAMATAANQDLERNFWDQEHGGLYWSISPAGAPLESRKQIYAQAFGIYGWSELYLATGDRSALDRAIALYRLIELHGRDREFGAYFNDCGRAWNLLGRSAPAIMGPIADKSQNTLLHVLEAYSNLLRAWPEAGLRRDLRALIETLLDRLLDARTHHLRMYVDADWTPAVNSVSYGHDIEFSWLLVEAAELLAEHDLLDHAKRQALAIATVTLKEGVDEDGGMFQHGTTAGVEDFQKEWWVQAEAAVGFLNAFEISNDAAFRTAALRTWNFIEAHFVDRVHGEWFCRLTRDRQPIRSEPKIGFWKCPYHNVRACLELSRRLRALELSQARLGRIPYGEQRMEPSAMR